MINSVDVLKEELIKLYENREEKLNSLLVLDGRLSVYSGLIHLINRNLKLGLNDKDIILLLQNRIKTHEQFIVNVKIMGIYSQDLEEQEYAINISKKLIKELEDSL